MAETEKFNSSNSFFNTSLNFGIDSNGDETEVEKTPNILFPIEDAGAPNGTGYETRIERDEK